MHPALQYAEDVISGKQIACKWIKLAAERHLRDLDQAKDRGLYFDERSAQEVITFVENLRHWKGKMAGKPIILEPHQQFYFWCLFGWKNDDGTRRFKRSYKSVARKNGKTTECAGIALYMGGFDGEAGAQVYFVATKEDQAKIGFMDAKNIVQKTPYASQYFQSMAKSIFVPASNSFIKPVGSDSDTQDGYDPHCAIIDEYHAHPNDGMLNIMETGMGAREQPMTAIITTAGVNKQYPCYSFQGVCEKILEGVLHDDTLFAMIFTLDKDDDFKDESVWGKSNPNLGVSVIMDRLRQQVKTAINEGGEKLVNLMIKNMNVWQDAEKTWIEKEKWDRGYWKTDIDALKGRLCYGGLDLARRNDFCSLTLNFPLDDGKHVFLNWCWIPEKDFNNRIEAGLHDLRKWVDAGFVEVTPGDATDYNYIKRRILELRKIYNIHSIGYDARFAAQLVIDLTDEEVTMFAIPQGFKMSTYLTDFENDISKGKINHLKNPVLDWMRSNVIVRTNAGGETMLDKQKSKDKIDGIVATLMSYAEHKLNPEVKSVYETRGIRTL